MFAYISYGYPVFILTKPSFVCDCGCYFINDGIGKGEIGFCKIQPYFYDSGSDRCAGGPADFKSGRCFTMYRFVIYRET